jgi:hypothetical protein
MVPPESLDRQQTLSATAAQGDHGMRDDGNNGRTRTTHYQMDAGIGLG